MITFIKSICIFCLFILVKIILASKTVGLNNCNNTCGSYNGILYNNETDFIANIESCLYYKDLEVQQSCCLVTFKNGNFCNILNKNEKNNDTINIHCPGDGRKLPNNCGFVGLNEPKTSEDCTSVNIPGLHCCMVVTNHGELSCRLFNYFAKQNQDSYSSFEQEIGDEIEIKNIICNGFNIKPNKMIILLFSLFLYLI